MLCSLLNDYQKLVIAILGKDVNKLVMKVIIIGSVTTATLKNSISTMFYLSLRNVMKNNY